MKVGVVGASGYAGTELLRLLAAHPSFEVSVASAGSKAGESVGVHTPALAAAYPGLIYAGTEVDSLDGLDVCFLALPHGESQRLVPELIGRVGVIVDLAADFRLRDAGLYPTWYFEEHHAPELLARFEYGLPELYRDRLRGATLVAAPGCYPTAAVLALEPFVAAGLVEPHGIVVDAASGVSGAGRGASERLHFGTVDENFTAYGLLDHRHTPEIEQALGASVLFTPHLVPMTRGILATCYARPASEHGGLDTAGAMATLHHRYDRERFVTVVAEPPATKSVSGTNCAHVSVRVDPRTGWLLALCAIDNLGKGAAGQAIQCANLATGLDEGAGLPVGGMFP